MISVWIWIYWIIVWELPWIIITVIPISSCSRSLCRESITVSVLSGRMQLPSQMRESSYWLNMIYLESPNFHGGCRLMVQKSGIVMRNHIMVKITPGELSVKL